MLLSKSMQPVIVIMLPALGASNGFSELLPQQFNLAKALFRGLGASVGKQPQLSRKGGGVLLKNGEVVAEKLQLKYMQKDRAS